MRMFLIAMCDLFLILYLTVLVQHGGRKPSKITLEDYKSVKASEEVLSSRLQEMQQKVALLEEERERLARAEAASERELDAVLKEKSGHEQELSDLNETIEELSKHVKISEKEREEVLKEQKELETRLLAAAEERQALVADVAAKQAVLEEARKNLELAEQAARQAGERSEKEKAEALEAARVAKEQAELAEARAELLGAQLDAARERTHQVRLKVDEVLTDKKIAETRASLAQNRALQAEERAATVSTELKTVNQNPDKAYRGQVFPKLQRILVVADKNEVFSGGPKQYESVGLPSVIMDRQVLFQHGPELGLRPASRYKTLSVSIGGMEVREIFYSASTSIVGLITPEGNPSPQPEPDTSMTPHLLAVRNNAALGLMNRIRDIRRDYFPFAREKLSADGEARMRYSQQGIRGTGDYATQILKGDQIANLAGELIGVAEDENLIVSPRKLNDWQKLSLSQLIIK